MTDQEEQERIKKAVLKALPKKAKPHNIVLALYPILTEYSKRFIKVIEEKDE